MLQCSMLDKHHMILQQISFGFGFGLQSLYWSHAQTDTWFAIVSKFNPLSQQLLDRKRHTSIRTRKRRSLDTALQANSWASQTVHLVVQDRSHAGQGPRICDPTGFLIHLDSVRFVLMSSCCSLTSAETLLIHFSIKSFSQQFRQKVTLLPTPNILSDINYAKVSFVNNFLTTRFSQILFGTHTHSLNVWCHTRFQTCMLSLPSDISQ